MRIQIDARLLWGGGIGRYLREITGRWLLESDVDRIRYLGRPSELDPWLTSVDSRGVAEVAEWSDPPYSPLAQLRWAGGRRRMPWSADVTFFPHYDVPLFGFPGPAVVTAHDTIHFEAPGGFPAWKRWAAAALMRRALERSHHVLTVSETSRDALEAFCPSVVGKTTVVHNGVSSLFVPLDEAERQEAEARCASGGPFLLTVGPARPHKNLGFAVRVLGALAARAPDLHLVMVGPTPAEVDRLLRDTAVPVARDRIATPIGVGDQQLRELYGLCEAFLSPSRVEGFGIPPLEAMACGAPVLASDISAARECLGEAAIILPTRDPRAWARVVMRLRAEGALRDTISSQGRDHASRFAWATAAHDSLEVVRQVARG